MDEWSVEYVERLRNQLNKGKQGTDVPALGALIRIIDHLDKQLTDTQAPAMRELLVRWLKISQLYMGAKLNQVAEDTKTLLEKAKDADANKN